MKRKPEMEGLVVPSKVFINMMNGGDYVPVPVDNLDGEEIMKLCHDFVIDFAKQAGFLVTKVDIEWVETEEVDGNL